MPVTPQQGYESRPGRRRGKEVLKQDPQPSRSSRVARLLHGARRVTPSVCQLGRPEEPLPPGEAGGRAGRFTGGA